MQRTTPELRKVARHRTRKRAHIAVEDRGAVIDCVVYDCRNWAPASMWKIPAEFRTHLILRLTAHRSAIAAWLGGQLRKSVLSSPRRLFRLRLDPACSMRRSDAESDFPTNAKCR